MGFDPQKPHGTSRCTKWWIPDRWPFVQRQLRAGDLTAGLSEPPRIPGRQWDPPPGADWCHKRL